jgi:serine/threonine-protein kinase
MKVVLPDLVDTPELADRFIREIKVQARLSHPNITSLHNAVRIENQLLMVMEFVGGQTLQSRLRETRVDSGQAIDLMLQVLSALAYAHAQGVVHRDIKPANIMLSSGGLVKLMDFGIARSSEDVQLTQTGAALGSVYYMSPEQVQGSTVDGRSDLYAVGIILYEMLTGVRPITGETSWAVMNAHVTQIPKSPSTVNASIPNTLSLAILKALEKNPADRYNDANDFAEMLRMVRGRYMPASVSPVQQTTMQQPAAEPLPTVISPIVERPVEIATPTPPSASALAKFDPDDLDQLRRALAMHVGPMAKILVDRAAKKSASLKELYEKLSAEVPDAKERAKFLASRPR